MLWRKGKSMSEGKKYIYDSTVNTKPWNSNTLYLDTNAFKEKQNNMANAEAQLVLDGNAKKALNDINGSLCINRLIQNWNDVSGAGDLFRNFGINDVDAALTKEQKSIVETDQANVGLTIQTMALDNFKIISNINSNAVGNTDGKPINKQKIYTSNSPFLSWDNYAADHTDNGAGDKEFCIEDYMCAPIPFWFGRELFFNKPDEGLYKYLLKKRSNWERYAEGEDYDELDDDTIFEKVFWNEKKLGVYRMLNRVDSGDAVAADIIYDQLAGISDNEFHNAFHFSRKADGSHLNYRFLSADFREETENAVYSEGIGVIDNCIQSRADFYKKNIDEFNSKYSGHRLLNKDGSFTPDALNLIRKEVIKEIRDDKHKVRPDLLIDGSLGYGGNMIIPGSPNAKGTLVLLNRLSGYLGRRGYDVQYYNMGKNQYTPKVEEISEAINSGYSVTFSAKDFELIDARNPGKEAIKVNGQEQLVVDRVIDGNFHVVYKGNSWIFKPTANSTTSDFYKVSITPKTKSPENELGANPFYGNRLWEDNRKNSDGNYTFNQYEKIKAFLMKQPDCKDNEDLAFKGGYENTIFDTLAQRGAVDINRVDSLIEAYKGREKEFREKYGFDLVDSSGNPNEDLLMVDFYLKYGNKMVIDFNDSKDKECYMDFMEHYYKDNPDEYEKTFGHSINDASAEQIKKDCEQAFEMKKAEYKKDGLNKVAFKLTGKNKNYYTETKERLNDKFAQYCKEHGDNATIKTLQGKTNAERMNELLSQNNKPSFEDRRNAMSFNNIPTNNEIKQVLKEGYNVVFECEDPYYLEDEHGKYGTVGEGQVRSSEMRIVNIEEFKGNNGIVRERYTVLCDGKVYYYDPIAHSKDCSNYYAIKTEAIKAAR